MFLHQVDFNGINRPTFDSNCTKSKRFNIIDRAHLKIHIRREFYQ